MVNTTEEMKQINYTNIYSRYARAVKNPMSFTEWVKLFKERESKIKSTKKSTGTVKESKWIKDNYPTGPAWTGD